MNDSAHSSTRTRVAVFLAAQLREVAQTRIVESFGAHVRGQGTGPSDEELRSFAKLVAAEHRLHRSGADTRRSHGTSPAAEVQPTSAPSIPTSIPTSTSTSTSNSRWVPTEISKASDRSEAPIAPSPQQRDQVPAKKSSVPRFAVMAMMAVMALTTLLVVGSLREADRLVATAAPGQQLSGALASRGEAVATAAAQAPVSGSLQPLQPLQPLQSRDSLQLPPSLQPLEHVAELGAATPTPSSQPFIESFGTATSQAVDLAAQAAGAARAAMTASVKPASASQGAASSRSGRASASSSSGGNRVRASASASLPGRNLLAKCDALNIFSRAICMNNSCAQRAARTVAECVPVIQQRRLDEARRNPLLLG